jgi:hypothetical protein
MRASVQWGDSRFGEKHRPKVTEATEGITEGIG